MLVWQFWIIFWVFSNLAGMIGSGEKVSTFMLTIPAIWREGGEIIPAQDVTGELELKNVHFTYPAKPDAPVLKGVSLKVDT
jgi:ABC-type multidrug transport system fused ATPase/permease subunit